MAVTSLLSQLTHTLFYCRLHMAITFASFSDLFGLLFITDILKHDFNLCTEIILKREVRHIGGLFDPPSLTSSLHNVQWI